MSRTVIPRHLVAELKQRAHPACPQCFGAGYVTQTHPDGIKEVRCGCCDRPREEARQ